MDTSTGMQARTAADRWTALMAARRVPDEILAHAPASPYRQDPERFRPAVEPPDTPSRRAAVAFLGASPDRTVLDVGCGVGAASLALVGEARHVMGVDPASDMLAAFAGACLDRGMPYQGVLGSWPEALADTGTADVVLCHHVGYDTDDLAPFAAGLGAAAHTGVVMEIHTEHPQAWLDPFFERFHGLRRPAPPTAEDAIAVLTELGVAPQVERWTAEARPTEDPDARAARVTRRLCLPPERAGDVAAALAAHDGPTAPPRDRVTLTWRP
ncbi:class I SAM-dependent methyltransferase [Actinomycetospora termitidis]|uniref:Class I SAM-dependent methyltransferase n=1 Tax=Actinomycetospora termitidis TaxID=3053470 RepID=A0ABT7MA19_9PSEU|nr:class I SAM-dependent methyltransferase [Actinomycetospora sp. Odt1-22]MDL5156897.1 class I SAM-dependent methyltransferase [Actinomycetospora sp. Odt1-22]